MCKKITQVYNTAKAAKVGETCTCICGATFTKTNYQQAFCRNKKGTKCKDKYWNTVTPTKKCNTTRISPASTAWMAANYPIDMPFEKRTSEGYIIKGGVAYNEFDEPMYVVSYEDIEDSEYWDSKDF